jgi:hypothetical protein
MLAGKRKRMLTIEVEMAAVIRHADRNPAGRAELTPREKAKIVGLIPWAIIGLLLAIGFLAVS